MDRYDNIVVGSGISGMTLALLLGLNGRKVLLLEKGPRIGGSLRRFRRRGIPFDTGFHFTGGFSKGGVLGDMLKVLGMQDYIEPMFLTKEGSLRFVFESEQAVYDLPQGIDNTINKLKQYFPNEKNAIDKYFEMMKYVCNETVALDLRKISLTPNVLDEDFISTDEVLNTLTESRALKGLLSAHGMCYGVMPKEISFANHSRVCLSLYESVACVKNGGDAFIETFQKRFSGLDIDVKPDTFITACVDIHDDCAKRFIMNTGQEASCESCILTIHPKEILKILPQDCLSKAFISRISSFEPSVGFFSVFGAFRDNGAEPDYDPALFSLLPTYDLNQLLDTEYTGNRALGVMKSGEMVDGKWRCVINAFEASFPAQSEKWKDSVTGHRPVDYYEYKQKRTEDITKRIAKVYPEYLDSFEVLDNASVLTCRDYLHSYDGTAYGIKQKIGQYNLFGKLPVRNMYAAGQSSVLPGLVGAMMSSFLVGRSVVGKERYNSFIERRLRN